jgi:hypothetical protein
MYCVCEQVLRRDMRIENLLVCILTTCTCLGIHECVFVLCARPTLFSDFFFSLFLSLSLSRVKYVHAQNRRIRNICAMLLPRCRLSQSAPFFLFAYLPFVWAQKARARGRRWKAVAANLSCMRSLGFEEMLIFPSLLKTIERRWRIQGRWYEHRCDRNCNVSAMNAILSGLLLCKSWLIL